MISFGLHLTKNDIIRCHFIQFVVSFVTTLPGGPDNVKMLPFYKVADENQTVYWDVVKLFSSETNTGISPIFRFSVPKVPAKMVGP